MSFQLFDLAGAAAEQGSLEYWWAGPQGSLLRVQSPRLGSLDKMAVDANAGPVAARFAELVSQLLEAVVNPGAVLDVPRNEVTTKAQTAGKVSLQCMRDVQLPSKFHLLPLDVCYDSSTKTIRLVSDSDHQTVRNRMGRFGAKRVAIDMNLSWLGRQAISGHVEQLESFDPAHATVKLEGADPQGNDGLATGNKVRVASDVLRGAKLGGPNPEYPGEARYRRLGGATVLTAVISKQGRIAGLFPLASTDPVFVESSMAAVSKWTYRPYLLNGEPTEVRTTVTVHYNLSQ